MNTTYLSWIIDIVIVGILITGLIIGCKHGAFNLVIYRLRKVLALAGALLLAKPLGRWIADGILIKPVTNFVMSKIPEGEEFMASTASELLERVPSSVRTIAEIFNFNLEQLAEQALESGEGMLSALVADLLQPVTRGIGVVIACAIIYILLLILLAVLRGAGNSILSLPLLKQLNGFLGGVLGLAGAFVLAFLLVKLFGWLLTIDAIATLPIFTGFTIEDTTIAAFFYSFDPIHFILSIQDYTN